MEIKHLRNSILRWYDKNWRKLPWRETKNPYFIWLSEIILQQTRIDQGLPYYQKFVSNYPTIEELALANEDDILKLWQGLGYYSRARNLHHTAKVIHYNMNNTFPNSYKYLIKLKGIGDYTASAISSICFNECKPAIDGNMIRVLSRIYGIDEPVDTRLGINRIKEIATHLISPKRPGDFNQAIMDMGATTCLPRNPSCSQCPIQNSCFAKQHNKQNILPIKAKKVKKKNRFFYYIIIYTKNFFIIEQRLQKDIWQNLYQFPLVEQKEMATEETILDQSFWEQFSIDQNFLVTHLSKQQKHVLTHQNIYIQFIHIEKVNEKKLPSRFIKIRKKDIFDFAVPKPVENYIQEILTRE